MVQSFDHEAVKEFELQNVNYSKKVNTIYLDSFLVTDVLKLSYKELACPGQNGNGCHIQLPLVTPELVEMMH